MYALLSNILDLARMESGGEPPVNVECYMLRLFAHAVACFCVLLGVVMQSLKLVKLLATCKQQARSFSFFPFLTKTDHCHGHHLEMK